eukprot:scaffold8804_cov115-Isochrysis_galbana.AAC.1
MATAWARGACIGRRVCHPLNRPSSRSRSWRRAVGAGEAGPGLTPLMVSASSRNGVLSWNLASSQSHCLVTYVSTSAARGVEGRLGSAG